MQSNMNHGLNFHPKLQNWNQHVSVMATANLKLQSVQEFWLKLGASLVLLLFLCFCCSTNQWNTRCILILNICICPKLLPFLSFIFTSFDCRSFIPKALKIGKQFLNQKPFILHVVRSSSISAGFFIKTRIENKSNTEWALTYKAKFIVCIGYMLILVISSSLYVLGRNFSR